MRKLPSFVVRSAQTVDEANEMHAESPETSAFYAGGTELLLAMKMGMLRFERLIDLKQIDELGKIDSHAIGLEIGANVTHRMISESHVVRQRVPVLADVANRVGNIRVRSSGTVGGNLAFAEPRSDIATLGLCLAMQVEVASVGDRRWIALEEFLIGPYETQLTAGDVLTRVRIPQSDDAPIVVYEKFQFHERPTVSVGLSLNRSGDEVTGGRIAIGSAVPVPVRVPTAEAALLGKVSDLESRMERTLETAIEDLEIEDDIEGSADYKAHLIGVLLRRLIGRATGGQASGRA